MCTKYYKRNNNKKDIFFVNNHVYDYLFKFNLSAEQLKKSRYQYVELEKLIEMKTIINNRNFSEVIKQYENAVNTVSNKILKELKCPYSFTPLNI